jgi:hypothetical protein
MKSGKRRRAEIKARRLQRAGALAGLDPRFAPLPGMVMADAAQLAHNNTYGLLPLFYVDRAFVCRDCGVQEVWTAKQQKWWYEVAKGRIDSTAIRCRACRRIEQARVAEARRVSAKGMRLKRERASKED